MRINAKDDLWIDVSEPQTPIAIARLHSDCAGRIDMTKSGLCIATCRAHVDELIDMLKRVREELPE